MTTYPVTASTRGHVLATVEYTRVTDNLKNVWDYQTVANQFIEDLSEECLCDDAVIVIAVKSIAPLDEQREEIDYKLILLITPDDAGKLIGTMYEVELDS